MAIRTASISTLKQVKNSVIGNPSAKLALARDEVFVRTLVQCLNQPLCSSDDPQGSKDNIRIEAAHVLSSLSYGSQEALASLLRSDALQACLYAISKFQPSDPTPLKAAFTRTLRALAVAIAETVGPSMWGLRSEASAIRSEAKAALDYLFQPESLDIFLPLLVEGSIQTNTSIAQLLASAVRNSYHRAAIAEWLPLADRNKEVKGKRGWEVPSIVSANAPSRQGGWVARNLTALLHTRDNKLQEAALSALAALAKENDKVSIVLSKPMPDRSIPSTLSHVLSYTKSRSTDVQLAACLCATHIIRASNTSHGIHSDDNSVRTIMNVVNRLISSPADTDTPQSRTKACFILYHLICDDANLCHFAHERGSLDKLASLVKSITSPPEGYKDWDEDEPESTSCLREAALTAISAISLFDDDIRREIADDIRLLPTIHLCMTHRHIGVRYATCQCIRAITRSVAVLRTSLVDSGLGIAVFQIFKKEDEDRRVTAAALAAICNIVADFSPLRPILLEQGLMPRLMSLLRTGDSALRLSSVWAIKNLLRKTSSEAKRDIMNHLGWQELTDLLGDPDHAVQEQAFGVLQNLSEDEIGIDMVLREMDNEILLDRIVVCLDSSQASMEDVVLQAVSALGNLLNGSESHQNMIISHPGILRSLRECLAHPKADIRRPAVGCVLELARTSPRSRREMIEAGVVTKLKHICDWTGGVSVSPSGRGSTHHVSIDDDKAVVEQARAALDLLEHSGELYSS